MAQQGIAYGFPMSQISKLTIFFSFLFIWWNNLALVKYRLILKEAKQVAYIVLVGQSFCLTVAAQSHLIQPDSLFLHPEGLQIQYLVSQTKLTKVLKRIPLRSTSSHCHKDTKINLPFRLARHKRTFSFHSSRDLKCF